MAFEWFRSWHGAPTDPKWLLIARKAQVAPGVVSAVAWALLDYASQHADRGSVDSFDVETYAAWAGWEEADVIAAIAAMRSKGIITTDNRLANWEKRQPKREDPTGNERQRNFRNRHRDDGVTNEDVTQSNASVTQDNTKSRLDQIRPDQNQRDGGYEPTPPPIDPFPEQGTEYREALRKLDANWPGLVNGSTQLKLTRIWGQVTNGKASWLDDAILEAVARDAHTPDYAVQVLATALSKNKRPGQLTQSTARGKAKTTSADLDAIFGVDIHGNPV